MLEKELKLLEKEKTELTDELNSNPSDSVRIVEITKRLTLIAGDIDTKEMRWLELSELD